MAAIDYEDYLAAGLIIFPLHPVVNGRCSCEKPDCEAAAKHPKSSAWQHTQPYDDDQLEYLEDVEGIFFGNQLLDHFGVLVNGLLVVDVDGRNGGFESAEKLKHIRDQCEFIVRTGSGNGEHWYFKAQDAVRLAQTLSDYPGIDFKSTGFVVGAHSLHVSGLRYEAIKGSPQSIAQAPQELVDLLKKPEREMFKIEGASITFGELENAVMHITNPQHDYHRWLAVGMALHHATGASAEGEELWARWTIKTGRDDTEIINEKWHSFGKSTNEVTQGTLLAWAKDGGYTQSVTFESDVEWEDDTAATVSNRSSGEAQPAFDLLNPPGLVGEIAKWINSRSMYPRKKLAVAAALQLVSNVAGLKYITAGTRTSLNLVTFGIAGSRTGKGAILRCMMEVHRAVGLSPATHGGIKSTQELIRNAVQHQAIHYIYDEYGKTLSRISNAGKGGAHYLEDLMAQTIAMYSEATGTVGITGDLKREMAEMADKDIAREIKKAGISDGENPWEIAKSEPDGALYAAYMRRKVADDGIVNPYLTFFAVSEPGSFNAAMDSDPWLLTGGLMGRALLFEELENVPLKKPDNEISRDELPPHILNRLLALSAGGDCSATGSRVERKGDFMEISWTPEASQFRRKIEMYWREIALAEQDAGSSLESQATGAAELAIKVAGALGTGSLLITKEDLEWAHELVKQVTLDKIKRAKNSEKVSSNDIEEKSDGLLASIMRHIDSLESGQYTTAGKARQAVGRTKVTLANVQAGLSYLAKNGSITVIESKAKNGKTVTHYYPK